MRTLTLFGLIGLEALLAGCGGAAPVNEVVQAKVTQNPCERRHPGVGAARLDEARQGNAVALVGTGAAAFAYVADEDARVLRTMDLDRKVEIATTQLAGAPSQVIVLADGRVAVALRDQNSVQILEPAAQASAPLDALCAVPVPAEPIALASTPDDQRLLVTSAWGRALTALDARTLKPSFSVPLDREPRAVVVDDSGERAFVAHVVGAKMSVVDLTTDKHEVRALDLRVNKVMNNSGRATAAEKLRGGCQGFALAKSVESPPKEAPPVLSGERPLDRGVAIKPPSPPRVTRPKARIFAPMVTVDPGDPNTRSRAYYGDIFEGVAKEAPIVSVIDTLAERPMTRSVLSLGSSPIAEECLLPRSAAVRAATGTLFVACLGIDALVEYDTRGLDPARLELRRFRLPTGPTGVAIDDRRGRAVVWSQFDNKLSVIDLDGAADKPAARVAVVETSFKADPEKLGFLAGRKLYHMTDDRRISADGSACASCHPDGREDALTWSTPDGPRQTIMLAGRIEATAPYGWLGKHDTLTTYVHNTFSRLGGTGLEGPEFDALLAYVRAMPGPHPEAAPAEGGRADLFARGRDLFFASEQGCATCHLGGEGTDQVHHDVASKTAADDAKEFDTPSLRFIGGTAPYFHDGRYATLDALLSANDSRMGHTMQLSRRDAAALKVYLEAL